MSNKKYNIEVLQDFGFSKLIKVKNKELEFEMLVDEENLDKIEEEIKIMEKLKIKLKGVK